MPPTPAGEGGLFRWLLGLEANSDELRAASVIFERPLPGWAWFLVIVACLGLAWWSYRRLRGATGGRVALGGVRTILLLLLAVLLAGPALRIANETIEEDWVVVLADRSRSMAIRDGEAGRERVSRAEALGDALVASRPTWEEIAKERTLLWLGFTGGAFDLVEASNERAESAAIAVRESDDKLGDRTLLDDALNQALQRAAARPIAGIVVMSDGRTTAPPSRATIRRLQAAAAKVFVVPLGSTMSSGDLAIGTIDAPRRAFIRDEVPVRVEIERSGEGSRSSDAPPAMVRLVDATTGETLAERPLPEFEPGATTASVTLLPRADDAGQRDWRVELDAGEGDLVEENNSRVAQIELVDRPLRVLYVDGYPRWEYRYLKNLLIRESTIESSVLLLSADRDFAQEGNLPITRLPRSAEEFAQFDLFVIGDVPAGFFTPEQLEFMRDQVAQRGTGVLWVAGERSTPRTWEGTAMAELLPMRPPLALPTVDAPVNMVATQAATAMGLLKVGESESWPIELADPKVGWSRLEWVQAIPVEQLKPTVEVLAVGVPAGDRGGRSGSVSGADAANWPIVTAMKYGAGEIVYVATDEIWRWRYGRGERFTEQVWLPIVRMLGREALAGGSDGATLRAVPARVQLGQPVRLELVIDDARLLDRGDAAVPAEVRGVSPNGADGSEGGPAAGVEIELLRTQRPGEFAATVTPDAVGTFTVRVPSGPAAGAEVRFECERPDDEVRRAAADHELLAELARETGGAVVSADRLGTLPGLLPKRSVVTEHATIEPLWDAPLSLILIVLLASIEWLGRRWMRLA
jgi:hypothetical protein